MTETEQLKKEAEMSLYKQRTKEVSEYMLYLIEESLRLGLWHVRCGFLTGFAFFGYFLILLVAIWMDTPVEVRRIALDIEFLFVLIAWIREHRAYAKWREIEGEWKGATTILRKMGVPLPEEPDGKRKVKMAKGKSPFRRFKEFTERMKSKDKMEAYA